MRILPKIASNNNNKSAYIKCYQEINPWKSIHLKSYIKSGLFPGVYFLGVFFFWGLFPGGKCPGVYFLEPMNKWNFLEEIFADGWPLKSLQNLILRVRLKAWSSFFPLLLSA